MGFDEAKTNILNLNFIRLQFSDNQDTNISKLLCAVLLHFSPKNIFRE